MGDAKDKKRKKSIKKYDEEVEFLRQLNIVEDLEEAEDELEDTYGEF